MIQFSFQNKKPEGFVQVSFSPDDLLQVNKLSSSERELSMGVGKRSEMTRRKFTLLARKIILSAKQNKIQKLFITTSEFNFSHLALSPHGLGEVLAVNFEMANFEFVKYKTEQKEGRDFVTDVSFGGVLKEFEDGVRRGSMIGAHVNACRELANMPGGEMTPELLAKAAIAAARRTGVKVKVLGKKEMTKLHMGGVLGVAQGSDFEPKFIIMEYSGMSSYAKASEDKPIVLIGKGVTFDSGGLNLKPSDSIYEMHLDMSGGAAVIHAIILAAKLKLKINVVALIPAVENMPSGRSYHPGDVLKSMSGKTIEILNTDAEGRVILADAITYAKKYDPALVVDVATLTGAAEIALGQKASALFTRNETLEKKFKELGEESGDYVWPLPLWDEYEDDIKGTFGDWANTSKEGRHGGAITAAMFLYQFAKEYSKECSWVHLDIAPRMTSTEGEYLAKGAAGAPVRLLVKLLENYQG
ncbi:leucyl aminopeptidase [bacterium]|nr:leucyl aminopeptidase [bacterium]